ncbi:tail protein [Xanthomonas phage pXoo2106]|uniref:Tail protein n=1 Tax=Xanthomonas phage pXoo2106 TaxID=2970483 RepID=A0AAX3C0Q0_9CAUD|nr:tail protein [Xanthomonas phage pXoo2106]
MTTSTNGLMLATDKVKLNALGSSRIRAATSSEITLPGSSYVDLIYNVEEQDALSEYNPSTGVFIPAAAGTYIVNIQASVLGYSSVAQNQLVIRMVDSSNAVIRRVVEAHHAPAAGMTLVATMLINLTAGVSYRFQLFSAVSCRVGADSTASRLEIARLF